MNAFLSGESFLCLAIKISSWINIYSNINPRGYIFISLVYTKIFYSLQLDILYITKEIDKFHFFEMTIDRKIDI